MPLILSPELFNYSKFIEYFEVRAGDCYKKDCKKKLRERSERSERLKNTLVGDEAWYGWSIYFPKDYKNIHPVNTTLGQFHQLKSYPAWMFRNNKGGYNLFNNLKDKNKTYFIIFAPLNW